MTRLRIAMMTIPLLGLLAACGPPSVVETDETLASQEDSILAAVGDVNRVTGGVGEAVGGAVQCGGEPGPSVRYAASARWHGSGDESAAERITSLARDLETSGWVIRDARNDDAEPYARLVKDELLISLDPDVQQGSDAISVRFAAPCVDASSDYVNKRLPVDGPQPLEVPR